MNTVPNTYFLQSLNAYGVKYKGFENKGLLSCQPFGLLEVLKKHTEMSVLLKHSDGLIKKVDQHIMQTNLIIGGITMFSHVLIPMSRVLLSVYEIVICSQKSCLPGRIASEDLLISYNSVFIARFLYQSFTCLHGLIFAKQQV